MFELRHVLRSLATLLVLIKMGVAYEDPSYCSSIWVCGRCLANTILMPLLLLCTCCLPAYFLTLLL